MRLKIFYRVFLSLLLLSLLTGGLILFLLAPQLRWELIMDDILKHLLWVLPLVVGLSLLGGYLVARSITRPLKKLSGDHPENDAVYEELRPLVSALRESRRTIHQQTETITRQNRTFDAVTGNMSESFLLLDKRLNVISRNESANYVFPAAKPDCPDNLNSNGCPASVRRAAEKAVTGQRTELSVPSGERVYDVIVSPVYYEGSITGAVVVAMDITEQEQREALRREFSANVSHELKTPLTSISGFAELMKDGLVAPERVPEFAGDIYRESQRLIALVEDIIELSRMEEGTQPLAWEDTDLYTLSREVLDGLTPAAERREITLQLEGENLCVQGIRTALREMVYNLCDNAVKYNTHGGSVTVRVEKKGCEVCLSVEDTGIGIPFAHQSRVFERFFRVDKSHSRQLGGTGLGLSIVKHAAQLHNARLELRSEPGKGTCITVYFPEIIHTKDEI